MHCRQADDSAYDFSLENQAGQTMNIGKDDREAIVTALVLHDSAKKQLQTVGSGQCQLALAHLLARADHACVLCHHSDTCTCM